MGGGYDKIIIVPLDSDSLHLGKNGYRILAMNIKQGIFGKRRGMRGRTNQVKGRQFAAGQALSNGPHCDRLPTR